MISLKYFIEIIIPYDACLPPSIGLFSFCIICWADENGKRDLCHGLKLTLIQPLSTYSDGTLQTSFPMICLLIVT